MKDTKKYLLLFLKGMGMGGADVVPGVSGGTIAFITGIYEELIDSISSINLDALKLLVKFRIKDFWTHINGTFLVVLLSGILVSVFSLAKLITYLIEYHPIPIWSFFFGLIIISAVLVAKEIKVWDWKVGVAGIVGTAIAFYVTVATPSQTPNELWFVFLSGAIAICAMILPGISGAFILLLLGKYTYIFTALKNFDVGTILVFALGCASGLLSFSRLISWFLKRYYNSAVALLAGFMIGSLNKIWPWKIPTTYRINSEGLQVPVTEMNVTPKEFMHLTGHDPLILYAILFLMVGIVLVIVIERLGSMYGKKTQSPNS